MQRSLEEISQDMQRSLERNQPSPDMQHELEVIATGMHRFLSGLPSWPAGETPQGAAANLLETPSLQVRTACLLWAGRALGLDEETRRAIALASCYAAWYTDAAQSMITGDVSSGDLPGVAYSELLQILHRVLPEDSPFWDTLAQAHLETKADTRETHSEVGSSLNDAAWAALSYCAGVGGRLSALAEVSHVTASLLDPFPEVPIPRERLEPGRRC
jgi:hypothetical protein